ncbi:MAG: hypothetical protein SV966_11245 [Actinomycetota bacterium]|nr:hypothetical protein [Actinomycetota bacterium]
MTYSPTRTRLLSATVVLGGAAAFATYAGRPAFAQPVRARRWFYLDGDVD